MGACPLRVGLAIHLPYRANEVAQWAKVFALEVKVAEFSPQKHRTWTHVKMGESSFLPQRCPLGSHYV